MDYAGELQRWLQNAVLDPDLIKELQSVSGNDAEVTDRFYKDLEFGTGGLRGVIGAGTNRMNVYTVGRATQGLSEYISKAVPGASVAIAYDSRNKSRLFAQAAASTFAANGIKVYIYRELMPTPMLSYAVRKLGCAAGVVVTASHNPAKYNGYKVYGPDGCQLTLNACEEVLANIEKVDYFTGVKRVSFNACLQSGMISYIGQDVVDAYLDNVAAQQIHSEACKNTDLKVVYTPLNGTGNMPVRAILDRIGVKSTYVVPQQELPDGSFPTCPFPNPEIREAFGCALRLAEEKKPDLLLATDPDCDRVGIAVLKDGEYRLMSGNEVGVMLLDYCLSQRAAKGTLPSSPVMIKTIVSTGMADQVAAHYGCKVIDTLTGFKFIGEQIGLLESKGEQGRYILGFEESYGYLVGTYVRDKDAVVAAMLICEMAAFYKTQGKTLIDVMEGLYRQYGVYQHTQLNIVCEGVSGMENMKRIMSSLRENPPAALAGFKVVKRYDYDTSQVTDVEAGTASVIPLPRSNVLQYQLENGASAIIRPSGTEPKIKVYLTAVASDRASAQAVTDALTVDIKRLTA